MGLARAWLSTLAAEGQHGGDDDLIELDQGHGNPLSGRSYRVRSGVLSDCGILPGDTLTLRLLGDGETPADVCIAAATVELPQRRVLLLRLFVPPRQLIINSGDLELPPLVLGGPVTLIAAAPWAPLSSWHLA